MEKIKRIKEVLAEKERLVNGVLNKWVVSL